MKRGKKLEFYMKEKGYTARSLSRESGVAYTTIRSMIENNLKNSSIDNVIKLCRVLGIQVEDLLNEDSDEQYVKEQKVEYNIIKLPSTDYKYFPTTISAGIPQCVEGVTDCETISIPDNLLGKHAGNKNIFFTHVNGESMNKVFPHESIIAIKPIAVDELKDGDIVVYSNAGEYSVKRFYKVGDRLIFKPQSTNPTFTDLIYNIENTELKIHGKVISYTVIMD